MKKKNAIHQASWDSPNSEVPKLDQTLVLKNGFKKIKANINKKKKIIIGSLKNFPKGSLLCSLCVFCKL